MSDFFKDLFETVKTVRVEESRDAADARIEEASARREEASVRRAEALAFASYKPAGGAYPSSPPANNVPGMPKTDVPVSNPPPTSKPYAGGLQLSPGWLIGGLVLIVGLIMFGGRIGAR